MRKSLFQTLAGPAFDRLPVVIQQVHAGAPSLWLSGACAIVRGNHWLARVAAMTAGMPPATEQIALRVQITADSRGERWIRHFGRRVLQSALNAREGLLVERLGPLAIAFALEADSRQLRWIARGGRVLGIPLPARFFAGVTAVESLSDGRYTFDVRAALPLVGLIIHYRGWLQPDV